METTPNKKASYRPVVGIAVVSLLICGLFFPLLITALGQVLFPYQANGSLVKLDGKTVGSYLIAENFALPVFFHPRNASASGVDPDITLQDALSQIPGISNATGISQPALQQLVNQNVDQAGRFVELDYVNVLSLNIQLVQDYPSSYPSFA
ncbi:MAG: potassium-transporting ATPase subunit C [Thaumarchaeota archaeon]|nr:potassium-transporting ATPase subunit C [Nitrososphaerota archaeon]